MKKSRFLALVLVASLSLVGAGYAYWSDAIFVNTTVKTGTFDVDFVEPIDTDIYIQNGENPDYITPTIDPKNEETIVMEISNLYPGKEVIYKITAINNGSIPAVLENIDVTFEGSNELKAVLDGKFGTDLGLLGFSLMNNLKTDLNKATGQLKNLRLEPHGTKLILGSFRLPSTVENAHNVEGKTLICKVTLNWTQHNDPAAKN